MTSSSTSSCKQSLGNSLDLDDEDTGHLYVPSLSRFGHGASRKINSKDSRPCCSCNTCKCSCHQAQHKHSNSNPSSVAGGMLRMVKEMFAEGNWFPSTAEKREMADEAGVPVATITKWFINQRYHFMQGAFMVAKELGEGEDLKKVSKSKISQCYNTKATKKGRKLLKRYLVAYLACDGGEVEKKAAGQEAVHKKMSGEE